MNDIDRLAMAGAMWQVGGMNIEPSAYRGFRFPAEIISHAVWLYHCFSLSLREVELILAQRGILVSYESIRAWRALGECSPTRSSTAGQGPVSHPRSSNPTCRFPASDSPTDFTAKHTTAPKSSRLRYNTPSSPF